VNASVASYREHAILTAPPERLVSMMYQGACRFLAQAAAAMEAKDIEQANNRLQRAEAIVDELRRTLDHSAGEISQQLGAIYTFCIRHLQRARLDRDARKITQVRDLLADLGEAWAQIVAP
jgi:flagellar protein FliS